MDRTDGIAPELQQRFVNLGFSAEVALEVAFTIGLLIVVVLLIAASIASACSGCARSAAGHSDRRAGAALRALADPDRPGLRGRPLLLAARLPGAGGRLPRLRSAGRRLEPVRHRVVDRSTTASIGANGVWYVQVFALVLGHAAGLTLAHDRALVVYTRARDATRSQYWMLAVMVAFTSLGLWLLSAAAQ